MFPLGSIGVFSKVPGVIKLDTSWQINSFDLGALSVSSITFGSDGSLTAVYNDTSNAPASDEWWTGNPAPGVGADYEVAFTAISIGAFTTGPALNEWTSLSSDVQWSMRALAKFAPYTVAANGVTFEIRPAGGGASIATITGCAHSASN